MSQEANRRILWFFGGAAVLVGLLLVFALVREPVQLDPNSPEGTVQNYLQAISDGDYEGAFNLIHPDWTEGCTATDLAASSPSQPFNATLGESETTQDTAFVTVTIREGASPGPLEAGMFTFDEFFQLENEAGQWMITGRSWPYFEWRCEP